MDSTTILETIAASQSSKEVTCNALVDALSPSSYGGRHAEASSGLTFGIYGGRWGGSAVSNTTISLGPSSTIYIVANRMTGAISSATTPTNWNDTGNYARLYKVVTGSATVTSYEDHRVGPGGLYASGGVGGTLTDGDKGDISVSSSGATFTIKNDVVTYAKMQNVSATARVLGRKTVGAGDPEELSLSDVLDFVGSAAHGDILYRSAAGWTRLAAGTNGQFLKTLGTGANPQWAAVTAPAKRIATPSWSSSMTLDWDSFDVYRITLGGNTTFGFSGGSDGQNCMIELTQDGTGSRTVTWPAGARFSADLPTPILTANASKMDKVGFQRNTAAGLYDCVAVVRGY